MKNKIYQGKIPFTKTEMLSYHYSYDDDPDVTWRDNLPFTMALTVQDSYRGRSAAGFDLKGSDGICYPMRLNAFTEMLKHTTMVNGTVVGTFIADKRGANYSLVLHQDQTS
jgi:hypothetical protein